MSLSLGEALEEFDLAVQGEVAPKTMRFYRYMLPALTEFFDPDTPIDQIDRRKLRQWRNWLSTRTSKHSNEPLANSSINGYLRATKRLFAWLVEEGELEVNPAAVLKIREPRKRDPQAISERDFKKIKEAARQSGARDELMVLFLADTGCRVNALSNLLVADVELQHERKRGIAHLLEKGGVPHRVGFGSTTYRALTTWLLLRPHDSEYVLSSNKGGGLRPSSIRKRLGALAETAGITGRFNPHSFRHRYARVFLENGGDISILSRLLGHADIQTTHRYYALWADHELDRWRERIDPTETGRIDEV